MAEGLKLGLTTIRQSLLGHHSSSAHLHPRFSDHLAHRRVAPDDFCLWVRSTQDRQSKLLALSGADLTAPAAASGCY